MVYSHERSPSEDAEPSLLKRMKMSYISSAPDSTATSDPTQYFAQDVLHPNNIHRLNSEYAAGEPFKYAIMDKLFQDDLLKGVKDECLSELSFTEKETDIYKVNQTGDLASLSFLTESQISLLPNLLLLRDSLYSETFRNFLRAVTGCGPLSGTKQDMSVNTYTKGCHLLNHDDVIGTRRVSYILYMPLPHYQGWQKEWGGALELYPVRSGPKGLPEPECIPSKCVPPSWNQFIFFEVQPGKSFHSVEEVVVGQGEDGRQRLSISGWFHSAQPGEPGHEPGDSKGFKSSREQLAATETAFEAYSEAEEPPLPDRPLSDDHKSFLSEFLNPVYLQTRTMKTLASRFVEESSLELHSFLSAPLADKLEKELTESDARDGFGPNREARIPPHDAGTDGAWQLHGPPHKWRYSVLKPLEDNGRFEAVFPVSAHSSPDEIVRRLQNELFPSAAFRAWLANVSRLLPLRYFSEARRFRPGLDYTLATSEEREARLDVVLGLTPDVVPQEPTEGETSTPPTRKGRSAPELKGWQTGEWGGWECYMAPHEEEDDPAVYRSGTRRKSTGASNGDTRAGNHNDGNQASQSPGQKHASGGPSDHMDTTGVGEEDEGDDGTLLTVQPGFNRLLLVLRDEGVMRFVKYISAAAEGSRWDVCGEYEIGAVEEMSE